MRTLLFFILISSNLLAQELFVMTEPASNMPTQSIGIRFANSMMKEQIKSGYNYHLMPEIMYGASKNLMVHATAFVSNHNTDLVVEGGGLYAKYRIF